MRIIDNQFNKNFRHKLKVVFVGKKQADNSNRVVVYSARNKRHAIQLCLANERAMRR